MKLSLRKSLAANKNNAINLNPDISASPRSLILDQQVDFHIYSWPIFFWPILYTIVTIIIMYQIAQMNDPQQNPIAAQATLKMLQLNLAKAPIIDFTNQIPINHIHQHFESCPYGYELAELGKWKGVNSGCLCDDGKIVSRAHCMTHFSNQCLNVEYHEGQSFTFWKGTQLCVLYMKDWIWIGNSKCPEKYKSCLQGICVNIAEDCPLTDLVRGKANGNTVEIGGHHFIKLRNGTMPLVSFSIIPGNFTNSPCFNMLYEPPFQSKQYYPLAIQPEKGCDSYGTTNQYTNYLDYDFQLNVYDDNGFTNFNRIPFFYDYIDSSDTYTLEAIKRIHINLTEECNHINPEGLKQMRLQSEVINYYTKYISSTTLMVGIFLLVTTTFFFLMRNVRFLSINVKDFQHVEYQLIMASIIAIANLCLGVIYFTQADGKQGLDGQKQIFRTYQKQNCFNDQGIQLAILKVIDFAQQSYSDTEPYVKVCFYFALAFLLSSTLLLLLQYKKCNKFFVKPWQLEQDDVNLSED